MTSRSLSRILTGLLLFPLACSSSGSSGNGTGGSNGTGTGGTTSTGTGGTNSTGTGGGNATGTGGTNATGTGGSNTTTGTGGKATGTGGTVVTGAGGSAGNRGNGGSAGSRASGGTTGGGGAATTGTGGSNSTGAGGSTADQNVLERNKNPSRDGLFIQPGLTKTMAMAMAADTTFNTNATLTSSTSANVGASPTYLDGPNGTGLFFIPTVGGDVIARKEDGTSAWSTSIGAPATGSIGCSNPTTPPLGILSTPTIDAQSKTIYVAGIIGGAQGPTAQIASAIDITTGMVKSGWPVDVGKLGSFDVKIQNQRSALSLVNGTLFIPYAGYIGDCGSYHGRVVAINTATQALVGQWATGDTGGGIWASGGLASDGTSVFASTGNYVPLLSAPATHTDSEEVVRISATGTKADYFYPASPDWSNFDKADGDMGSNNPILINVPGATPSKLIVAIAKGGNGYLLDAGSLHGSTTSGGGEKATFSLATGLAVYGSPASYKTAMGTYVVMNSSKPTGCPGGTGSSPQVMAVRITPSPLAAAVVWCAPNASSTNPIATTSDGTADAIVWYMNNGKLTGVDGDTGATVYTSSNSCANVPKWSAPIAVKGRIIAAGNGHLCAWGIPGALSQATPQPAKAKRHKRTIASVSPHDVL